MAGGLGDAVSSEVGRLGKLYRMGIKRMPRSGSTAALMEQHHISSYQIILKALAIAGQGHPQHTQ